MIAGSGIVLFQALTSGELLKYLELFKVEMTIWEKRIIFELDDNVLPILNTFGKDKTNTLPVNDSAGLLASYRAAASKGE